MSEAFDLRIYDRDGRESWYVEPSDLPLTEMLRAKIRAKRGSYNELESDPEIRRRSYLDAWVLAREVARELSGSYIVYWDTFVLWPKPPTSEPVLDMQMPTGTLDALDPPHRRARRTEK
ncbi:hypothetical protein [Granulicoccus phenolivorans]|uniref:hypothetical protein n=1 Tax=Granulicoccus phenolivorans TaxID=266854 RepID=UPI0011AE4AAA|nr:hypothetical protein [Granulicoccus phenolivorans]